MRSRPRPKVRRWRACTRPRCPSSRTVTSAWPCSRRGTMPRCRRAAVRCSTGAAASSVPSASPPAASRSFPTKARRRWPTWRAWPGRALRTRATRRTSRRWPKSRNSSASPPCSCTGTAPWPRATATASTEIRMALATSLASYRRRRRQLMRMAGEDAILVLPAAPVRVRSRDTHYPYRPDSDLLYLCGFEEPEAVLVLVPGRRHGESLLFCRERDPGREAWDGPRLGPEGAPEALGVDDAYDIDDIDDILPGLLEGRGRVYYHFGRDTDFDLKLIGWVNRVRAQVRHGAQPPHEFLELGHLLDEMRLFKGADELKLMRRAAKISVQAHQAVMRAARAGMREYELQAELERVFRAAGTVPAYGSIFGAGANGCVLHYVANNGVVRRGDMVLVDAGAEYRGYAADITRTFPVDGRFSREQRVLHDLVDAAHAAAMAQARPGVPYEAGHDA